MIDIRKILALNVKQLRKRYKLSQADFAEAIDVQMQAISQIENAKTYPLPETISNICKHFGISPASLFSVGKFISDEQIETRENLLSSVNILLSEMDNDKLKLMLKFSQMMAEQDITVKIKDLD